MLLLESKEDYFLRTYSMLQPKVKVFMFVATAVIIWILVRLSSNCSKKWYFGLNIEFLCFDEMFPLCIWIISIYSFSEVADWTFFKICKNFLTRYLKNVESVAFFFEAC